MNFNVKIVVAVCIFAGIAADMLQDLQNLPLDKCLDNIFKVYNKVARQCKVECKDIPGEIEPTTDVLKLDFGDFGIHEVPEFILGPKAWECVARELSNHPILQEFELDCIEGIVLNDDIQLLDKAIQTGECSTTVITKFCNTPVESSQE